MQHLWTPWRMVYLQSEKPACCILCRVAAEDADDSNYIVYRGEHAYIMLNLYPYNNGHLMVVPYRHIASPEELDASELLDLVDTVNLALAALRNSMSPDGFNIGVNLGRAAGAGIDAHMHVHVVPRWEGDTNFMPLVADTRVIPETLPVTCSNLRESIVNLRKERSQGTDAHE